MTPADKKKLMTSRQRAVITKVANSGQTPHNARAKALLAVDDGVTQSEAGEQNGLTRDIVKYWLMKFRKSGVSIFPAENNTNRQLIDTKNIEKKQETAGTKEEKAQPSSTKKDKVKTNPKKKKNKKNKKDKKKKEASEKTEVVKKKKDKKKNRKKNSSNPKDKKKKSKPEQKEVKVKKQKDKKSRKKKDKKKK